MSFSSDQAFPKSARLLKRSDFFFASYERFQTEHFRFFFSRAGEGRIGISLSKKVMKASVARNRVRRLVREVFRERREGLPGIDLHLVGLNALKTDWNSLNKEAVAKEFQAWEAASTKH
ncbi:ribonuclease P protein component [bacterium]|nr:ribonuclease P protein component [bacterium]